MTELTTEQMLIGMALNSGESLRTILNCGITSDILSVKYKNLFTAMQNLAETQGYYDLALLGQMFPEHTVELATLSEKAATGVNPEFYAKEYLVHKTCLKAASKASGALKLIGNRKPFGEIDDILVEVRAISECFEESIINQKLDGESSNEILDGLTEEIEQSQSGKVNTIKTGFNIFDAVTGGLRNGSYIVIAARTKVGKTSLWISLLRNLILDGKKITVFSIEMDGKQLFKRLISSMTYILPEKMDSGKMTEDELDKFAEAQRKLYKSNVTVFGQKFNNFLHVERILRDRIKKGLCEIVVIDYIQQYRINRSRKDHEDLGEVTNRIQDICKTLNIPFIVIAQLNRGSIHDQSGNEMAYIKGCGGIEQDADVVCILSRETTVEKAHPTARGHTNAVLKIPGNRFGREAEIALKAELDFCKFTEK